MNVLNLNSAISTYTVHTSISVYDKKQFWAETVIISLYISRDILCDSTFYYKLLKL